MRPVKVTNTKRSAAFSRLPRRRYYQIVVATLFAGIGSFFIYQSFAANANLPGDINSDNKVNLTDLSQLLSKWNSTDSNADVNGDNKVSLQDLSILLSNWNKTYTPGTPPTTPPASNVSLLKAVSSYTTKKNLSFGSNGSDNLLDLYIPNGSGGPYPLIIYVHGGGWFEGNKEGCVGTSGDIANMNRTLILKGFAVACINYRLTNRGAVPMPAQIIDVKASIRYLRANAAQYGIYATKIGLWGDSAGGHLSALAGTSSGHAAFDVGNNLTTSSAVQAVTDYFGPTDVYKSAQGSGAIASASSPESWMVGGAVLSNQDKARATNPIAYIDAADPPFLIYHGTGDGTVPYNQSQLLDTALRQANVPSTFNTIQGANHEDSRFFQSGPVGTVANFFDQILR